MKGLPRRIGADFDFATLDYAAELFLAGAPLPESWKPHPLGAGRVDWTGYMECHLAADWLLIYIERGDGRPVATDRYGVLGFLHFHSLVPSH
jgi:mRNA-degrading endonuclease YafQ of YafQ-DinJ toxin-antitoxin module